MFFVAQHSLCFPRSPYTPTNPYEPIRMSFPFHSNTHHACKSMHTGAWAYACMYTEQETELAAKGSHVAIARWRAHCLLSCSQGVCASPPSALQCVRQCTALCTACAAHSARARGAREYALQRWPYALAVLQHFRDPMLCCATGGPMHLLSYNTVCAKHCVWWRSQGSFSLTAPPLSMYTHPGQAHLRLCCSLHSLHALLHHDISPVLSRNTQAVVCVCALVCCWSRVGRWVVVA